MNSLVLFLTLLISSCSSLKRPFDFVEYGIHQVVDWDSDPCENFYRHACPLDKVKGSLVTASFENVITDMKNRRKHEVWKNDPILDSYYQLPPRFLSDPDQIIDFFNQTFRTLCKRRTSSVSSFLNKVEHVFQLLLNDYNSKKHIEFFDINCNFDFDGFKDIREYYFNNIGEQSSNYLTLFAKKLSEEVGNLTALYGHLDINVLDGISKTYIMLSEILDSVYDQIEETPWAMKNNVVKTIQERVDEIRMKRNVEQLADKYLKMLTEVAENFDSCLEEFKVIKKVDLLCYIFTAVPIEQTKEMFFTEDNAHNYNDWLITFGFPHYYQNTFGRWLPANLGYTGFFVAHEIGHTFVEHTQDMRTLGYFSNFSVDCIQGQFRRLCEFYEEGKCEPTFEQFDDNGADIFGLQFAYKLLEKKMNNTMGNKVKTLEKYGVTNEQLFFYSYALGFCSGSISKMGPYHSANNVRVNLVAQHPGFQKAFQCPDNSKMMQAATEQCHLYGKDAPLNRRKFSGSK